ncbi:unnamed protein product, partial [Symbiodinium necroappetens]
MAGQDTTPHPPKALLRERDRVAVSKYSGWEIAYGQVVLQQHPLSSSHPRHPGQQDVAAYFPHGETAATNILVGQLAFLSHVKAYEDSHPGTQILQPRLVWKYELLLLLSWMSQSLSATELDELSRDITEVSRLRHEHGSWAVRVATDVYLPVRLECVKVLRHGQLQGPGTVIKYGSYVFYAKLGVESFFAHGHELHDPGGLRYEKKALRTKMEPQPLLLLLRREALLNKRPKVATAADASPTKGNSFEGEVPEALRKIIRENGLLTRRRNKQGTQSEGTTRYAYEAGDTVHGKMDARRAQQEEELRQVLRKARTNPWHLFGHGLLHRVDQAGNKMYSTYGDALKTTPWDSLPAKTRKLLGGNYIWATWLQHPMSGYGIHFLLKVFELGKLQGNYLVEFSHKPHVYSQGYVSPRVDDTDYAAKLAVYPVYNAANALLKALKQTEDEDISSAFARKAKSDADLIAYESLKAKRARELEELEELDCRSHEDIAVEEFLEKLPGSQGEMADSSTKDATNVPMETDASPPGEASGAKVEKTEGSLQGEVTGDVHMG